jgi:hypothetical protein
MTLSLRHSANGDLIRRIEEPKQSDCPCGASTAKNLRGGNRRAMQ